MLIDVDLEKCVAGVGIAEVLVDWGDSLAGPAPLRGPVCHKWMTSSAECVSDGGLAGCAHSVTSPWFCRAVCMSLSLSTVVTMVRRVSRGPSAAARGLASIFGQARETKRDMRQSASFVGGGVRRVLVRPSFSYYVTLLFIVSLSTVNSQRGARPGSLGVFLSESGDYITLHYITFSTAYAVARARAQAQKSVSLSLSRSLSLSLSLSLARRS